MREAGFDVQVIPADIDESARPGEGPFELVERLARTRHQREVGLRELVKMHVVQADGLVCGIDAAAQALR